MDLATVFACSASRALSTVTSMRVSAPSPSRAIALVRSRRTVCSASASAASSTVPATPLANTIAVSLVLVSVSTDTQLSVLLMTPRKMSFNFCGSTFASVNTIAIRVAMFGSIMPTPLATPTTRAVDPAMVADEIL